MELNVCFLGLLKQLLTDVINDNQVLNHGRLVVRQLHLDKLLRVVGRADNSPHLSLIQNEIDLLC
jgi:hypothetical protein